MQLRALAFVPVLLLAGIPASGAGTGPAPRRVYDVIVAGAGAGGTAAAIEAARLGASVALLEETDWIGGQMTAAGVSTMDDANHNSDSGIYREFINLVAAHYAAKGKSVATGYWSDRTWCFEPGIGQRVLYDMIRETKARDLGQGKHPVLDVLLRTPIVRVLRSGGRVTGVVTRNGATLKCKVLIDATEFGDLFPLAGVRYRIANSISDARKPESCVQDITYTAIIKRYPQGVPAELRLNHEPPGYTEAVRRKFAKVVTRDGQAVWNGKYPVSWAVHNEYRGVPDSSQPGSYTGVEGARITKTGVNWANDFAVKAADLEPARRKDTFCRAKLHTLQFLYYMQHELGETEWSIANDEGYDTPFNRKENSCDNIPVEFKAIERQFPPMPYVRESQRLIGPYTLTAAAIWREGKPPQGRTRFPSAVAVGDYMVDLHGCDAEQDFEAGEHRSDMPAHWLTGPFQVPFDALFAQDLDGLMAAEKNLSQTRLASGATRVQPTAMLTGQAVGAIAALAARGNIPPRRVNPLEVQKLVLAGGSRLTMERFADVPKANPLWAAVQLVVVRGLMQPAEGGRFGIDEPLLRGQAAAALARRFGSKASPDKQGAPLTCAELGAMLAESVGADKAKALLSAGPRPFRPAEPAHRGDLAAILAASLK